MDDITYTYKKCGIGLNCGKFPHFSILLQASLTFSFNNFQMNLNTDKLTIYCNIQMMTTFDGYSGTNKFKLFNCANSLLHI